MFEQKLLTNAVKYEEECSLMQQIVLVYNVMDPMKRKIFTTKAVVGKISDMCVDFFFSFFSPVIISMLKKVHSYVGLALGPSGK